MGASPAMGGVVGVGWWCRALLDFMFRGFATEGHKAYYGSVAVLTGCAVVLRLYLPPQVLWSIRLEVVRTT